ncbi:hypothetical protein G9A89_011936 [Geosiphon pyriformis]|nr:hypothetical protein G9A89_011936 [Geosiphon pyriformis]
MGTCCTCGDTLLDEEMWKDIPERRRACNETCQYTILINDWVRKKTLIDDIWKQVLRHLEEYPHDEDEIWRMAYAMSKGATTEKLREIKNNSLSLSEPEYVQIFDVFSDIEDNSEEFHEHYQQLALIREEQNQHLEEINTQLCDYCLIPCDFQYCDECDLIYNPPPHMIYTIPEEKKPISSCALESELLINRTSNSDNDDNENTGSSSVQNSNNDDNNSNSDSNSDLKYE